MVGYKLPSYRSYVAVWCHDSCDTLARGKPSATVVLFQFASRRDLSALKAIMTTLRKVVSDSPHASRCWVLVLLVSVALAGVTSLVPQTWAETVGTSGRPVSGRERVKLGSGMSIDLSDYHLRDRCARPRAHTDDPLNRTTTIQRDAQGNPLTITQPNGAITTMTYDPKGNLLTSTEPAIAARARERPSPDDPCVLPSSELYFRFGQPVYQRGS